MRDCIYDFIGIGIGPFNLSLACMSAPLKDVTSLFLDKQTGFDWHPGMMLPDATLQTPFMSDLVTMADPTSPYSFLNYIKQQGRLYSFYIRESFFLLRQEYNQYCQWATEQLANVRFNCNVQHVEFDVAADHFIVQTSQGNYFAKHLVIGTGPTPQVPKCAEGLTGSVIHSSQYLEHKVALQKNNSISIIGSGQSAAEIFYDLLQDIDLHRYQLNWVTRSPRFYPLEYSKLTLEMTSPEYVDYFYQLPSDKRQKLNRRQHNLYKGINSELINNIFDCLYRKKLSYELDVNLHTNSRLNAIKYHHVGQQFEMEFQHTEQNHDFLMRSEGIVFATGYKSVQPGFLSGIESLIDRDEQGQFQVARNYSIDKAHKRIFIQNAEHHTHGFATPDLGMACYRNACLLRAITGHEHYLVERQIAFQQFAAPGCELATEIELFRA
ncbi:lysine N(6)-hydroxylase/L-ornithine N(5)-oxygenase family protein [Pseudoalteromonas tunicata]|uniref:Putative siderophore biosynthetic enzyme n=1 Tax=Pseudoalteromonas tunicata D2 TaxID=87626 RepID=A4CDP8_9GAMM|nr:lysine N(6)-hydroxylase/L-ornithine N(5)-oxygenase family protein [Pseudoalteromonas tunicata]ATC96419.1 lysine N6-hydroxylase [Pseudoalteromonas tunicata]AXT31906.1 alcaligin biosynthesis protein [Pseudoalteromonas tunicata]EAR27090.1 putative siderophore biosynthetic enzyme [Pseudoalteromonas tunicata D2]MDP4985300.1 lysine N(6)-hydroxylase/L-ornithine N(5)-oxygenase family protein [Pseudoalteromonas tunicata]